MIIYDNSETKSTSRTPKIRGSIKVNWLEELTGADICISPLDKLEFTQKNLEKHLYAGAYLVQIKSGEDLTASVGTRMNMSLSKMMLAPRQGQRILLYIGKLERGYDDECLIDGTPCQAPVDYFQLRAAIAKWMDRGGVFEQVVDKKEYRKWVQIKERHSIDNAKEPKKIVFPDPKRAYEPDASVLQQMHVVNDSRQLLVNLPGIGEKTANMLWEEFNGKVGEIICYLTNPKQRRIKGIGSRTIEKVRDYLGMDEIFSLTLEVLPEVIEKNKKGE